MEDHIEALLIDAISVSLHQVLELDKLRPLQSAHSALESIKEGLIPLVEGHEGIHQLSLGVLNHDPNPHKPLTRRDHRECHSRGVVLLQDIISAVGERGEPKLVKGVHDHLVLLEEVAAGDVQADLRLAGRRRAHVAAHREAARDAVLVDPLLELVLGVAGVCGLDGEARRDVDGEEPAAVHAALGAHVDPGADPGGVDDGPHVVEAVDLGLGRAHVPEEVHHALDEDALGARRPPRDLLEVAGRADRHVHALPADELLLGGDAARPDLPELEDLALALLQEPDAVLGRVQLGGDEGAVRPGRAVHGGHVIGERRSGWDRPSERQCAGVRDGDGRGNLVFVGGGGLGAGSGGCCRRGGDGGGGGGGEGLDVLAECVNPLLDLLLRVRANIENTTAPKIIK